MCVILRYERKMMMEGLEAVDRKTFMFVRSEYILLFGWD